MQIPLLAQVTARRHFHASKTGTDLMRVIALEILGWALCAGLLVLLLIY
jgi:hypothetical protein